MSRHIILYGEQAYNPFVALARDLLNRYNIPFTEVEARKDKAVAAQVTTLVGELLLPTLLLAEPNETSPYTPADAPHPDRPLTGQDRGSLISTPNNRQLENWLHRHKFLDKPYKR